MKQVVIPFIAVALATLCGMSAIRAEQTAGPLPPPALTAEEPPPPETPPPPEPEAPPPVPETPPAEPEAPPPEAPPAEPAPAQPPSGEQPAQQPEQPAQPPRPRKPRPVASEADKIAAEGIQAITQGDLAKAEAKLREALEKEPKNPLANMFLCYVMFRRGDMEPAKGFCLTAIESDPPPPMALLLMGRVAEATGDTPGAMGYYVRASEAGLASKKAQDAGGEAVSGHANYLAGLINAKEGQKEKALANFDAALEAFPKHVHAHYERGLVLLDLGRNEEAAAAFGLSISERKAWPAAEAWLYPIRRYLFAEENAHYWRGVALFKAGKLQEAVDELAPLIPTVESRIGSPIGTGADKPSPLEGELDQSYHEAHLALARAYKALGQKDKALETLRSLLKIDLPDKALAQRARELLKAVKE